MTIPLQAAAPIGGSRRHNRLGGALILLGEAIAREAVGIAPDGGCRNQSDAYTSTASNPTTIGAARIPHGSQAANPC
ncbi:MAG: hypothetical protein WHX52_21805 [Anaerolineae bacterium]